MNNKLFDNLVNARNDELPDNVSCLEWLKNQLYPDGLTCSICKQITKHHKVSYRSCYACDRCGNQVYPAAETIFKGSKIPLKTWFDVIRRVSATNHKIAIIEIQRDYGLAYLTARNMLQRIRKGLDGKLFPEAGNADLKPTGLPDIGQRADPETLNKPVKSPSPQTYEEPLYALLDPPSVTWPFHWLCRSPAHLGLYAFRGYTNASGT